MQQPLLDELRSMRGMIEQRFGALAFMEKLQKQPRQAELSQRLLDIGFSPQLVRKLVDSLPEYAAYRERVPVRLVGVALTHLTPHRMAQKDLFTDSNPERWDRLYKSIDRLRGRYGFNTILRAQSLRTAPRRRGNVLSRKISSKAS